MPKAIAIGAGGGAPRHDAESLGLTKPRRLPGHVRGGVPTPRIRSQVQARPDGVQDEEHRDRRSADACSPSPGYSATARPLEHR